VLIGKNQTTTTKQWIMKKKKIMKHGLKEIKIKKSK
jgi:hypothetical protein